MRVITKIILDIETGCILERECFQYTGPLAECISGSGSSQKSKSKSQSTTESGTRYNEDFLNKATDFAAGRGKNNFDAQAYLKNNPDVAAAGVDPYEHYLQYGRSEGRAFPSTSDSPSYNPTYVRGAYTSVAPEGFAKLEDTLYGTQASKLKQAYDTATAQQREELAQSGALNSPSQYLEGSARSSLDRSYINSLQQAARDAFMGRLGMEQTEAARRTGFDVSEAGRETGFNQDTASKLLDLWLKKLGTAIEAGRYSTGQSTSSGTSSGMSGSGGIFQFGGSSSS